MQIQINSKNINSIVSRPMSKAEKFNAAYQKSSQNSSATSHGDTDKLTGINTKPH